MAEVDICNMALGFLKVPSITSVLVPTTETEDTCSLYYAPARKEILRKHPWNFAKKRAFLYAEATGPAFEFDYKFALPTDFIRLRFIGTTNQGLVGISYDIEQDLYLSTDTYSSGLTTKTITGITKANPGVVTATAHGFINGDIVVIEDVVGMTTVNDTRFIVAEKTTNTFELTTTAGVDVDTSGYTAYASGGTVYKVATLNIGYIFDEDDTTQFDPLFVKAFALQLAVNMSYAFTGKTTLRTDVRTMLLEALQEARAINGQDKPPIRITKSRVIGARRKYSSGIGYEGDPSRIPD